MPTLSPLELVADAYYKATGWTIDTSKRQQDVRCPAHEDSSPSMSVGVGIDGRVLLTCQANCQRTAVLNELNLKMADLFPPRDQQSERPQVVDTYRYTDEHSGPLFTVEKLVPGFDGKTKSFRQVPASGKRGRGAMDGIRRVPFQLPALLAAAQAGDTADVVEGEKDVLRMRAEGMTATCNPGGAGKWRPEFAEYFRGLRSVRVICDNDAPGIAHGRTQAASLRRVVPDVTIWLPKPDHKGADVSDHLSAGYSLDELVPFLESTQAADESPADLSREDEDQATPEPEPEHAAPRSSWSPVDLSEVLSDDYTPPQPSVLTRSDGRSLLYPGKVASVFGASESGKTWFCLFAAMQQITDGHDVAYLDFEDSEGSVVPRLRAMGAPANVIREHFHYVRPDRPLEARSADAGALLDLAARCVLVIIDGVSEAMVMHDRNPDVGTLDVIKFYDLIPRPLAAAGPAVAMIDHIAKGTLPGSKSQMGSGHKKSGLDVSYSVAMHKPFGVGLHGEAIVTVAKDRPGQVRAFALGTEHDRVGSFHLESSEDGTAVARFEPPDASDDTSETDPKNPETSGYRPTYLMEQASLFIEAHPGTSKGQVEKGIKGKKTEYKRAALARLEDEGHVSTAKDGQAIRYTSLKPYREAADPDSDKYEEPTDPPADDSEPNSGPPRIDLFVAGEVVPLTGEIVRGPDPVVVVTWPDDTSELAPTNITPSNAVSWAVAVWADRRAAA